MVEWVNNEFDEASVMVKIHVGSGFSIFLVVLLLMVVAGRAMADPEADYQAGLKYYLSEDLIEAMSLLQRAADAGHVKAQYLHGYILNKAGEDKTALSYYHKAAAAGNAEAMAAIGTMYAGGDGVEKDHGEAVSWYHKAADAGHNPSLLVLGTAYFEGKLGLETRAEYGKSLLKKAADAGYEAAKLQLEKYADIAAESKEK